MIVAGIDVGSLSVEAVILRDSTILGYSILAVGTNNREAAERAFAAALDKAGVSQEQVKRVVATGYGRQNVLFAERYVTEITCHARGAVHIFPNTRTVIDIGGQDSKVIRTGPQGEVVDFVMNDRCAAGTGRFLEMMARALETTPAGIGELAAGAVKGRLRITNVCAVFAESEVISLLSSGEDPKEIARALCESVSERLAAMVRRVGLAEDVAMSGGVAKNQAVVAALAQRLGVSVAVPPEPQIIGAVGAALIARDLLG